jgi:nitrate/nitrite transporter NarK
LRTTWGMVCGNFCVGYLAWIYFAWLPGYLEIQHHLSVAKTGIYAAIPPLLGVFSSLLGGYLSDRLAARGVTPLNSRKIPIISGIIGTATCRILAAYSGGLTSAMIFISAAVFFSTITSRTVWALVTAAAPPNYVASIGSIQNFFSAARARRSSPGSLSTGRVRLSWRWSSGRQFRSQAR